MNSQAQIAMHPSAARALGQAQLWAKESGERRMASTVIEWLEQVGWLGRATRVALELPWRGRRIDMITSSGNGRLSTFEFKLSGIGRALEQAMYNSVSAHRSFVVLGSRPLNGSLAMADRLGLGVLMVNGDVQLLRRPDAPVCDEALARQLRERVRARTGDVRAV